MSQAKKVLIIEDSNLMRLQVKHMLEKDNFTVVELTNAEDYISASWQYKDVELILLDINLPGMNGLALLEKMNSQNTVEWPPVIMLSGSSDKNVIRKALLLGAIDYILKPIAEEAFLLKINNLFDYPSAKKIKQKYLLLIESLKAGIEEYRNCDLKQLPINTITQLHNECIEFINYDEIMLLFIREFGVEDYSFRHGINVAILSGIIGKWVGFKEEKIHELVLAGLMHDLGKVKIPHELLYKTGTVSLSEKKLLQNHVVHSYDLMSSGQFSKEVLLGVLQHHERMDGSGYPQKLLGREICMAARIIAVADVYDAMISNKAYRKAETPFAVIEEVFKEMFDKLDPHICTVFLKHIKERLVGQVVVLADGSHAKVVEIKEHGFAAPVLRTQDGKQVDFTVNMNIVEGTSKK